MAIRLSFVVAAGALTGLVACASLVTLDNVDPSAALQSEDGGVTGTGSVTTKGGITIAPTTIDMPGVRCGTTASKPITLTNGTDKDVPFQVTLPPSSSFQIGGGGDAGTLSGTIPAKGDQVVTLIGLGNAIGTDSVSLVVSAGDDVEQVDAKIERLGGRLTVSPQTLDFGQVREAQGSPQTPVVFQNDGNQALTITAFTGTTSNFVVPTGITVPAGGSTPAMFALNPSSNPDPAPVTANLQPETNDAYCGAVPTLMLSGQRVNTQVTVNTTTLDFGKNGCGPTPPSAQPTFTISNFSNAVVPWTATLANGATSRFGFVGPSSGNIATANGTAPGTVTVTLQMLSQPDTPGDYTEQLELSTGTDGVGDGVQKTQIKLTVNIFGATFALTNSYQPFPPFPGPYHGLDDIDPGTTGAGTIENTGNATACVTYSINNNYLLPSQGGSLDPGSTYLLQAKYVGCTGDDGTLTINHANCNGGATSAPFCGTPPTIRVHGNKGRCQ